MDGYILWSFDDKTAIEGQWKERMIIGEAI
jgi:hypothetical protein